MQSQKQNRTFVLALLILMLSWGTLAAADPDTSNSDPGAEVISGAAQSPSAEGAEILETYLRERLRLNSGVARYQGESLESSLEIPERVEGAVQGVYAFDRNAGTFRFDNREPHYHTHVSTDSGASEGIREFRIQFIRTRDHVAEWASLGTDKKSEINVETHVHLRPPDAPIQSKTAFHPFDIFAVGLLYPRAFYSGQAVEEIVADYLELPIKNVVREPGSELVRLEWDTPVGENGGVVKRDITFDAARGMCPISMNVYDPPQYGADTPLIENRTDWEEVNGVWVPVSFMFWNGFPPLELTRRYSLEFQWENVNEPIDSSWFDYETFDGPTDGRVVIDTRKSKNRIIKADSTKESQAPPKSNTWIGLNCLAVGIFGLAWFFRRKRNVSPSGS